MTKAKKNLVGEYFFFSFQPQARDTWKRVFQHDFLSFGQLAIINTEFRK